MASAADGIAEAQQPPAPANKSSSAKAFTMGGIGAQPTLDDIVRVALGCPVALDAAGAARIKQESPAPKNFQAEAFDAASAAAPPAAAGTLSPAQARAVLACRLLTVMNGKTTCRLAVAEYLAALLNLQPPSGAAPALALPSGQYDSDVLSVLALVCHCHGALLPGSEPSPQRSLEQSLAALALSPTAPSAPATVPLSEAGLAAPGLSAAEHAALRAGSSATAGLSALVVAGAKRLLAAATGAAALSCEAVGFQTKVYDADVQEATGHNGAIQVADDLRGLLEGSKRVNTLKGGEELHAFVAAPQRLGALSEAITQAYSATRAEVQAAAPAVAHGKAPPPASPLLPTALLALARALLAAARDAGQRAARAAPPLGDTLKGVSAQLEACLGNAQSQVVAAGKALVEQLEAAPGVQIAQAATAALNAAQQAVALEALAAAAALRMLEGPPAPPTPAATEQPSSTAPEASNSAAPAEVADGAAAAGGKKDKKDGAKKDRKGGAAAAGVVVGKGSALMRAFVEKAAATPSGQEMLPADASFEAGPAWCSVVGHMQLLGGGALAKALDDVRGVLEANQARRKPKIAKGARDFLPDQMAIREKAFAAITGVFKRHGAVAIDTPVFELRETLMGKYGEDSKLIYDLADQGGEILSLRYDLTVPFARYVAVHSIGNIKRYHIGKVYRRDQPQMNKGRFREFFQCDFDIAGTYASMVPDAEVVCVLNEVLSGLELGGYEIKLNHRGLLDAMMAIAGVPAAKFRPICSAIDKLDKEPWSAVRQEMVEEKGLDPAVADRIGEMVVLRGEPLAMVEQLSAAGSALGENPGSKAALEELRTMFGYLEAMGGLRNISLDLSLARGLDYYTGVIYEAVLKDSKWGVGSIAAGGRYDKLVGMFSGKDVPAVGVSIGIERVFAIMEAQIRERAAAEGKPIRSTDTQVLVASIGNGLQVKRMEIASRLWAAGISAEFGFKPNPKMGDQLGAALEGGIPFMVLFGDDELKAGTVKIKDMDAKTEDVVLLERVVEELKARIAAKQQ